MKRREFTRSLGLAAMGAMAGENLMANNANARSEAWNLKYAPHLGMFSHLAGDDPLDQLNFIADQGFKAFEDNDLKLREKKLQDEMARIMEARGIQMGVFVAHKIYWNEANLTSGDQVKREEFLTDISSSIEVAKRMGAKWMTVVPGHLDLRQAMAFQTAHVIESLKRACELLEPHDLVMVLEPLNFRDHPGLFLSESPQAFEICRAVDSPSCKILFDIYHQQVQEGNLIPNIERAWEEIAYFQIGDNPGRNEPTTGEINYHNVFKYIYDKGYDGILGMEHGNSIEGASGEKALLTAYRKSDDFLG